MSLFNIKNAFNVSILNKSMLLYRDTCGFLYLIYFRIVCVCVYVRVRARMILEMYAYATLWAFGTDISQRKYLDRVIKHREKCRNSKPRRSARCIMYEYHTSQSTARGAKRLFLRWRCHAMKLHQLDLRLWTTIWRSLNSVSPDENNFLVYL